MKIDLKKLNISILVPLIVGYGSSVFISDQLYLYDTLSKPFFAPEKIVFPIVWTVLYITIGVSFYLIWTNKKQNIDAYIAYGIQLFFNFFWPILFFNGQLYLVSFIWIILLGIIVVDMIYIFYKENIVAALLLIPYLLWILFAIYLNGMIYLLN